MRWLVGYCIACFSAAARLSGVEWSRATAPVGPIKRSAERMHERVSPCASSRWIRIHAYNYKVAGPRVDLSRVPDTGTLAHNSKALTWSNIVAGVGRCGSTKADDPAQRTTLPVSAATPEMCYLVAPERRATEACWQLFWGEATGR
jgi:hypothetical protein